MVTEKLILANSLFIFLMEIKEIDFEFEDERPLKKYIKEGKFNETDVLVSLMKWECHHGLKIDPESFLDLSHIEIIEQIDTLSDHPTHEYMDNLMLHLNKIKQLTFQSEHSDVQAFDFEYYINNKN